MAVNPLDLFAEKPAIAHQSVRLDQGLTVHYRHDLPGTLDAPRGLTHHMLTFFLSKNERQVTSFDECGKYDGAMEVGDFYLYPAGRPGFTRWQSVDKTLHIVLEPDFLSQVAIDTDCLNPGNLELLPVLNARDRKLAGLMPIFLQEIENGDLGDRLYLESLSSILGIHLLRQYCQVIPKIRQSAAGLAPKKLSTVLEYIQARLSLELSLDAMAAEIGVSRCHFATQFKRAMGLAPHQYVSQQRIEKAKRALRSHQLSIAEVALECGFSNQSHLTKVFKKQTGTTPKAYRERL